ncbi:MAG TPA: RHS repeat-associated core domain-containing protein, partial [Flavobacterium sp.]|nr:RHS repeat-associated core domain-containing protein [Flavobacterium sp.]
MWLSVDPLAEQTMEPYQYVSNNPINIIDPTGMYGEKWEGGGYGNGEGNPRKGRGDKVLHFKQDGKDMSVYENDKGLIAGAYRFGKSVREWTDEKLSGGFYFYDDEGKPKGDQS